MKVIMYITIGLVLLWYVNIIFIEIKGRKKRKRKNLNKNTDNLQNFGTFVDNLEKSPEINLMEELEKDVQESSLLDAFKGDSELENENNNPKSLNYEVKFKVIKKNDEESTKGPSDENNM